MTTITQTSAPTSLPMNVIAVAPNTSIQSATFARHVPFLQFDPGNGVLRSATFELTNSRITGTLSVDAVNGPGTGIASATVTPTVDSGAGETFTISPVVPTVSCSADDDCSNGAAFIANRSGPAGSAALSTLDAYVGTGTLDSQVATTVEVTATAIGFENVAAELKGDWETALALTYGYQAHARPTFEAGAQVSTLLLDFGTTFAGDVSPTFDFRVFNDVGDRVGLDLDQIQGTGDVVALLATLARFNDLAPGESLGFSASLDTSTPGSYAASYSLELSDADGGASSTLARHTLTIDMVGTIAQRGGTVAETGTLALLALGAGLARMCSGSSRARRHTAAAPAP